MSETNTEIDLKLSKILNKYNLSTNLSEKSNVRSLSGEYHDFVLDDYVYLCNNLKLEMTINGLLIVPHKLDIKIKEISELLIKLSSNGKYTSTFQMRYY